MVSTVFIDFIYHETYTKLNDSLIELILLTFGPWKVKEIILVIIKISCTVVII